MRLWPSPLLLHSNRVLFIYLFLIASNWTTLPFRPPAELLWLKSLWFKRVRSTFSERDIETGPAFCFYFNQFVWLNKFSQHSSTIPNVVHFFLLSSAFARRFLCERCQNMQVHCLHLPFATFIIGPKNAMEKLMEENKFIVIYWILFFFGLSIFLFFEFTVYFFAIEMICILSFSCINAFFPISLYSIHCKCQR